MHATRIIVGILAWMTFDLITSVMDIESTKLANTIATNVTSTMLTKSDDRKARYKIDRYISQQFY